MASTVDGAITALCALLSASPALSGVSVHDGPPMTAETPDWIAVGYQPGSADAAVITWEWAGLGAMKQEERYDVLCSLMSASGDEAMSTRRTRAGALLDVVRAVVKANPVLTTNVRLARMSTGTLLQEQSSQGALAGYTFAISVEARISA